MKRADNFDFVVVAEVVEVKAPLVRQDVFLTGLTQEELGDPRSVVLVRPMKSTYDPQDKLLFFGESSSVELSVPGPFVQPINLSIEQSAVGVHLSVDVDAVHDVSVLKWLEITKPPGTLPALLKKAPTTCLHHGSLGAVLFPVGAAESPVTQELIKHKCAIANCGVVLGDAHEAIGHSSYIRQHLWCRILKAALCALGQLICALHI